ncbi:MAG: N-6 DNA methylase [Deltaproteobacteria bacterium]|nr:N-6 DNA methylase [Deltaproteobacteria bacterium]
MLDTDTKRRIDTARDILVGKVPDPKSQVEQITIALIYKFMDDMDAEAEELGGKRKFFTGNFARYGWAKLMSAGIGGYELIGLYGEGISTMPQNAGIPPLFRDIFKNAYLPYRDPETLKSFLKIIDEFSYDHSESLGDAFEYLLSVLGSQGDAGQFRTPRHIIDFIVEVINPKKGEMILDPACGTAGFLISAYKHILRSNSDDKNSSTLTPDEKGQLSKNFKGYDISPDMVRLSLVNLYLHGFTDPHIFEYDTLTSEDRWNEFADVILANPPFMSPKGGIKPHKRFSIQAKRSEVLFVDYIAEHLTPTGRAGIIVPEGIIFQSQGAYKELRKMLVENSLVAVISLPAGCFNPYSGVKTSILILDKSLARQSDSIAFFKVENDGFGLGAQRRSFDKNDLPQVKVELEAYLQALHNRQDISKLQLGCGLIVAKEKIAASGDYNLSGERYREKRAADLIHPFVALGDLCEIYQPKTITQQDMKEDGAYLVYGANGVIGRYDKFNHEFPEVIVTCRGATCGTLNYSKAKSWITGNAMVFAPKIESILKEYLFQILKYSDLSSTISGSAQPQITRQSIAPYKIPLPLLEVQKEIVAEIEGYQKVIDGARAVLDNYRPHIPIHPDWPMVSFDEIVFFQEGPGIRNWQFTSSGIKLLNVKNIVGDRVILDNSDKHVSEEEFTAKYSHFLVEDGDIILASSGATYGKNAIFKNHGFPVMVNTSNIRLHPKDATRILQGYIKVFLDSPLFKIQIDRLITGAAQPNFGPSHLKQIKIPLPPLATQQTIVAEIEAEQRLVNANNELIERFEKKIQITLARVWGEP